MPQVNPEVLRWARESAGLSPGEAVEKLGLRAARGIPPITRLQALEEGEAAPTRAMLSKMAAQYRRPLVTFYLERPPPKGERGTDFRTVSVRRSSGEEAMLDALARRLLARQELLKSALLDEDAEPLSFIGSVSLGDGVPAVVAALRETLGLPVDAFRAAQGRGAAFRLLRARVEETGVFVLLAGSLGSHQTNIEVEVFRGMALADEIAPFVVVNPHDSSGARCFTLLHELAHLWLGQTGVSGGLPRSPVERFCNDVASEYLLPDADFTEFRVTDETDVSAWASAISARAAELNVSSSMLAYRLFRAGSIDETLWNEVSGLFRTQWLKGRKRRRARMKTQTGGPGYYRQMNHQLGSSLVQLTGRLMASGALTTTKAGRVLGVRPKTVHMLVAGP